ncbi:MAG TPA: hypothetical protein VN240_00475 [Propylenella sp.]|nr:hypothetical protein [Propylenella sp.]
MFDIGKLIDFPKFFVDQAIALLIAILVISFVNPTTRGGVLVLGAVVVITVNAVVVLGRLLRRAHSWWKGSRLRARLKHAAVALTTAAPADPLPNVEAAPGSVSGAAMPIASPLAEGPARSSPTGMEGQSEAKPAAAGSPAIGASL